MDRRLWGYVNFLGSNDSHTAEETICILLSVCGHILNYPHERKFRELRLDDPRTIMLFTSIGAMECLFEVGFIQNTDRLTLPHTTSLIKLQTLELLLSKASKKIYTDVVAKKFIVLPATLSDSEKRFFTNLVCYYSYVMRYEDSDLQKKVKQIVPVAQLEIKTIESIRALQKNTKLQCSSNNGSDKTNYLENEVSVKDLFLMELLNWFKNTFFQWFNQPVCTNCKEECILQNVIGSKNPQISKIEVYKCNTCDQIVQFPRYSDPEPLLTSRIGRCGEWANTFTLLCRSLGYDARLVWGQTDHLWTEVWSMTDLRWIHLDPCENVIDQPLLYERGWNKKLTYIIAFSKDEVQDVTWRYTKDQDNVRKRRNLCSEDNLLQLLESINEQRQTCSSYSAAHKKYVVERRALELARMLYMKTQDENQIEETYQARNSGSYAWRLARGEVSAQSKQDKSNIWHIPKNEGKIQIKYFTVKDVYEIVCSTTDQKSGWETGMDVIDGSVFRKVENDWKFVYLACSPNCTRATVKWTFVVDDPKLRIETFNLKATTTIFNDAKIHWELETFYGKQKTDSVRIPINDCSNFSTEEVKGSLKLILSVTLIGGNSELAWQHAQLFRRSLVNDVEEPSMTIIIQLKDPS